MFSDSEEEISAAQPPIYKMTKPHKGGNTSSHKENYNRARGTKRPQDDERRKRTNNEPKKTRISDEHVLTKEKIERSRNFIELLQAHLEKGACPKSLRYNVKASIMPDEEFKSDVVSIRKRAEHDFVGALVKFHHRRIETLTKKIRKLEQTRNQKRNEKQFTKNVKPLATSPNCSKQSNINKLATELETKMTEVEKLLVTLRAQTKNKEVKPYICVFSGSSYI